MGGRFTGVFALVVALPADYPHEAPTVLFETPVYHCNVSEAGTICLDLLGTEGGCCDSVAVDRKLHLNVTAWPHASTPTPQLCGQCSESAVDAAALASDIGI